MTGSNEIPLEDIDEAAADRAMARVAKELGTGQQEKSESKDPEKRRKFSKWAKKTK